MPPTSWLRERDEAELRAGLTAAALPTPHQYVRGLDVDYDREVMVRGLVGELEERDDLRLAAGGGADERWVFAERLPWDSEFFGRGVGRVNAVIAPGREIGLRDDATPEAEALRAMLEQARAQGIEYLTATATAEQLPLQRALTAVGFQLVETRLAYWGSLDDPPAERFPARPATPDDIPSIQRAARESVNPFDRFHADVHFPAADADRLMERWVETSVLTGYADEVLVPDEPAPEAFVTLRWHREHWDGWGVRLAQPIVAAVLPRHRGWYYRLIAESMHAMRAVGADHICLVTQITNVAVLRGWQRLGFSYGRGEHVYSIQL